MNEFRQIVGGIILVTCICTAAAIGIPVVNSGSRDVGTLETVDGIAFPNRDGQVRILETLAHTDVYLREPVFAKTLLLAVTFDPGEMDMIEVGVRENGFWLSYSPVILWDASFPRQQQTRFIEIPLTGMFQEPNQSIDVMFFTKAPGNTQGVEIGVNDHTDWEVVSISASTRAKWPSLPAIKDYIRSLFNRERAL